MFNYILHSSPKPYAASYNTNSYIASSKPVIRPNTPTGTANPVVTSSPPRPAPRKITNQSSTDTEGSTTATEEVTLVKDGGSLGFSIIGGSDHSCTPFGGNRPGIFISHIVPGGIAASSGKLRMGDRIIKAYGEDLTKCKHQEAVMTLLKPSNEITLTVQHDPLPEGFQDLTIVRQEGEKLGMHIKGGIRGHRGNPMDKSDEGVFISKINSGGAAKRDGRLKVGMRLLEVNGESLLGASHQEAVKTLRNAGLNIHLVVCKGYDKGEVDKLVSEGKLSKENKSASHSVSSLDKEDEYSDTIRQEHEMKQELVAWEKEEQDKKDREQTLELEEVKNKSTPEKVMDVVHAAEVLALGGTTASGGGGDTTLTKPKSPGGPKSGDGLKTTTIVMSKHTLAPQSENNQLDAITKKPTYNNKEDRESSTIASPPITGPLETSLDCPKLNNFVPKPYIISRKQNVRPVSLILDEEDKAIDKEKIVYKNSTVKSSYDKRTPSTTEAISKVVHVPSDNESNQTSSQTSAEHSPSSVRSILKSPPFPKKVMTKHTPERGEFKVKIFDMCSSSLSKQDTKLVQTEQITSQEDSATLHQSEIGEIADNTPDIAVNIADTSSQKLPRFKSATLPRAKTVRFDSNVKQHQVPVTETEINEEATVLKTSMTQIPSPSRVEVTTIQTTPTTTTTSPTISCSVNIPLHVVNNEAQSHSTNPFFRQAGYMPIPPASNNQNLFYAYPYFIPSAVQPAFVQREPLMSSIQLDQNYPSLPTTTYMRPLYYNEVSSPYPVPSPARTSEIFSVSPINTNRSSTTGTSEIFSTQIRPLSTTDNNFANSTSNVETIPNDNDQSDSIIRLSNTIQNIQTNEMEERNSVNHYRTLYTTARMSENSSFHKTESNQTSKTKEKFGIAIDKEKETSENIISNSNAYSNAFCYKTESNVMIDNNLPDVNFNEIRENKCDINTKEVEQPKIDATSSLDKHKKMTNYSKFSSPLIHKQNLKNYEDENKKSSKSETVFRFSTYKSSLSKDENEETNSIKKEGNKSSNFRTLLRPSAYKSPSYQLYNELLQSKCGSVSNIYKTVEQSDYSGETTKEKTRNRPVSCYSEILQEDIQSRQSPPNYSGETIKEKTRNRPVSCYSEILQEDIQSRQSPPAPPPPINYTTYPTGIIPTPSPPLQPPINYATYPTRSIPIWQEIYDKTPPLPGPQNN